jgi:hypothetical protein
VPKNRQTLPRETLQRLQAKSEELVVVALRDTSRWTEAETALSMALLVVQEQRQADQQAADESLLERLALPRSGEASQL